MGTENNFHSDYTFLPKELSIEGFQDALDFILADMLRKGMTYACLQFPGQNFYIYIHRFSDAQFVWDHFWKRYFS